MFNILVVEDDKNTRLLMEAVLKQYGYNPILAADGEDALEIMDHKHVDLVLLDVMMPRMDGYTATREIRTLSNNRKANIPIVAMTANAFEEDRRKAFECGMNGHIVKPIDMESIAEILDQIFNEVR